MHGPANRFELLTCAFQGHVLAGVGAARITAEDALIAREEGGLRWHRCLRCDAWIPSPVPDEPTMDRVPPREAIEVPVRGRQLRDRWVLRLIALDRAFHVLLLGSVGLLALLAAGHERQLRRAYNQIMDSLAGGPGASGTVHGFLGHFQHYLSVNPTHLVEVGIAALAYAALEAVEMVGLWFAKRWAEYLTFVATIVFIPIEVAELVRSVTVLKLLTFAINVAIALYLLLAKRLFGLRGGHRAVVALREADGGWRGIELATVAPASG